MVANFEGTFIEKLVVRLFRKTFELSHIHIHTGVREREKIEMGNILHECEDG